MAPSILPPASSRVVRIAALLAAGLAVGLGFWQVGRHGERNAGRQVAIEVADAPVLGAEIASSPELAWRQVAWPGHFDGTAELMSGRPHGDTLGYGVLQPFRRDNGELLFVDRGWVGADAVDEVIRAATADDHPRILAGQLRPLTGWPGRVAVVGHGTRIWPPREVAAPAGLTGAYDSLYVVAGGPGGGPSAGSPLLDGYDVVPPRDDTSAHYAAQWFAIALVGLFFAFYGGLPRFPRGRDGAGSSIG